MKVQLVLALNKIERLKMEWSRFREKWMEIRSWTIQVITVGGILEN